MGKHTENTKPTDEVEERTDLAHDEGVGPQAEEEQAEAMPKKRRWPFFLFGLLLGIVLAVAGIRYLADQGSRYLSKLGIVRPVVQLVEQTAPQATPVITEEDRNLLRSVVSRADDLKRELSSLARLQQSLSQARLSMESLQLRDRLSWISNPAYHLPQIQLAWQEIALLPSLDSNQRSQAERMQSLAASDLAKMAEWQQRLLDISSLLSVEEKPRNIIPETDYPWLNWVLGKFSLSPALDDEQKHLETMRQQLLQVRQDLGMEVWPDQDRWRTLRAEVQLFLAHRPMDQGSTEIGVPESFGEIQQDIASLRQAAKDWMGRL
jgi:hypothetical protein